MISYRYSVLQLIKFLGFDTGSSSSPAYQDLNFKIDIPTKTAGHFSIFGIGGIADVSFLASKDASFLTAETIQVGGGQALGI